MKTLKLADNFRPFLFSSKIPTLSVVILKVPPLWSLRLSSLLLHCLYVCYMWANYYPDVLNHLKLQYLSGNVQLVTYLLLLLLLFFYYYYYLSAAAATTATITTTYTSTSTFTTTNDAMCEIFTIPLDIWYSYAKIVNFLPIFLLPSPARLNYIRDTGRISSLLSTVDCWYDIPTY